MSRYRGAGDASKFDITSIINRILESNGRPVEFSQKQLSEVITAVRHVFYDQSIMLELESPCKVVGNINGHLQDLANIFKMSGYPGEVCYLFLGDYVDRGPFSIECIVLLFCYKIKFPEHVFLLRGHHQIASVNRFFGFYDECKHRFDSPYWKMFNDTFNMMPLCAVIEHKIFCVHGGLSPQLESINQIMKLPRPLQITNNGIGLDMLWSDPEMGGNGWIENQRGISYSYGVDVVYYFLKNNNFDLMVRSHQVVENGYDFALDKKLVTIFSVPNYLGEYDNYGAILVIDEDLSCSFDIIKPKFKHRKQTSKPRHSPFKK